MSLLTLLLQESAAYDLVDNDLVREYLQKQAGVTTSQDELTSNLVTRMSVLLQNTIGRQFVPTDETRTFDYGGGGTVFVTDIQSVTDVTYDADGTSPATLTSGSWRLRGYDPFSGTYKRVLLTDYTRDWEWCWDQQAVVSITGTFGFTDVPADVQGTCLRLIRDELRGDVAFTDAGVERLPSRYVDRIMSELGHYWLPSV